MRICYVGPSSSVHLKKWCRYFANRGDQVYVVTFDSEDSAWGSTFHLVQHAKSDSNDLSKLSYLACRSQLKAFLEEIKPDVIHAHYASSYGALCAASCSEPYYLSVWGSDVYDFPKKSPLHRLLLNFSLSRAMWLMSTSDAMAAETHQYTNKPIEITPFGVDTIMFAPDPNGHSSNDFTVGTVKGLHSKYGIDTLLQGCALALEANPAMPLKIRIAGKGPEEKTLRQFAKELDLESRTEWLGFVEPVHVPQVWQSLDAAIVPSRLESESFGVSAVEAQACGLPIIVSDVPGLQEATIPGETSLVVSRDDPWGLSRAILDLYENPDKRRILGESGRRHVVDKFNEYDCFHRVGLIYEANLKGKPET